MLFVVRHGQTVWNRQLRLQGRADSPLTRWGVELALTYGAYLKDRLDTPTQMTLCSSPLGRAAQTAALIADVLGLPDDQIITDPLLAEHDIGDWQGQTWAQIESRSGIPRAQLHDWSTRPPGGETRLEMLERARTWLTRPRPTPTTIAVTHGGLSRAPRGAHLNLLPPAISNLPPHHHGRLYELHPNDITEHITEPSPTPPGAALS